MRQRAAFLAAIVFALSIGSQAVSAAVVNWTLQNISYADGTVASGDFDWDSDTNSVVDWDISITDGSNTSFPATTFNPGNSVISFGNPPDFFDVIFRSTVEEFNGRGLDLRLGIGDLDNLDTATSLLPLVQTDLTSAAGTILCYNCSPLLDGNSGGALSSVVPLPAAFPLLLSALSVFGFFGWRRRQTAAA